MNWTCLGKVCCSSLCLQRACRSNGIYYSALIHELEAVRGDLCCTAAVLMEPHAFGSVGRCWRGTARLFLLESCQICSPDCCGWTRVRTDDPRVCEELSL